MDTNLRLYAGVPISRDDLNFLDGFTSEPTKLSYFESYKFLTFETQQIQRDQKVMYVEGSIEEIERCNYLSFQNGTGRRYWCFVTEVVYESDDATKLVFEVDFMTTWLDKIVLKDSMIERQHVKVDTIGLHTLDENLDIGETIVNGEIESEQIKDLLYVFVATQFPVNPPFAISSIYSGVFSGLAMFATDSLVTANTWITFFDALGDADALVTIFMMPKNLVTLTVDGWVVDSNFGEYESVVVPKYVGALDGETPKNNKLYSYPYNFLEASNNQGQNKIYRYEFFDVATPIFLMTCNVAPSPTVYAFPNDYKGVPNNVDENLTLTDYPLCSWRTDVYKNWLAQSQVSNAFKVAGSVASIVGGAITGNALAVGGGAYGLATSIGEFKQQSLLPDSAKGNPSGGGNIARGQQFFTFYQRSLRAEKVKEIDSHFTMFGYKVNVLETPELKTRTSFNYIKTLECNIGGEIPATDLRLIKDIFNKGVTFWHTKDVGNYQLDNTPT